MKNLQNKKLSFGVVYSKDYYADIGTHVFPIEKYKLTYEKLKKDKIVDDKNTFLPVRAKKEDLLLAHTPDYIDDFLNSRLAESTFYSELPLGPKIVKAFVLACGGSIVAAKKAVESGCVINIGGGFHHAMPNHAEGFCYLNDIAVAIRRVQKDKLAKKVLVVDCDLHQGNGTAKIFSGDKSVFTFSVHQENNYPVKEKSSLDIGLEDGVNDGIYLSELKKHIPFIIKSFSPDLIFYVAGADPYKEDQLGGLCLTIDGLRKRDEFIFSQAFQNKISIAVVLAGGYAYKVSDTVQIHYNTCRTAWKLYG